MSLSTALATAMTGLTASSRAAGVASDNIANAMTEGFARREIDLGTRQVGKGVSVLGIDRVVDAAALQDQRLVTAERAGIQTRMDFLDDVTRTLGLPGQTGDLSGLVSDFEARLVSAAARPHSLPALSAAVDAADRLAERFVAASSEVQGARAAADGAIARAVESLNADLVRVAGLNADIARATLSGATPNALLDARQQTIDRIAEHVPVRELARPNGGVALLSEGGLLLDGDPVDLAFVPATAVGATTTLGGGLAPVTADGHAVDMARATHLLSGGRLAALFDLRDVDGPAVQADLDALARDLVDRMAATDTGPGGAGIFTDAGAPLLPGSVAGLSARLAVNDAVLPRNGGAAWRLRDGLAAAAPGPEGDATRLRRAADALSAVSAPAAASLGASARTFHAIAADTVSHLTISREGLEAEFVHATVRADAVSARMAAGGVNTDSEMQKLLLIERAYAANARVISAAGQMIDTLLEL